ncbi:hypothetical protein Ccrd_011803 [Cynara cardunculus var. scolymus]|uniref:Uncharacterized protein n=2 Tax=Cynara cardunculus var. scolymus TaxID=59895 RepID=A0A103YIQ1_CYNCS|nr:hypothetical protein Ccrd_011803 [Cynara cardunculus var. scolymus]
MVARLRDNGTTGRTGTTEDGRPVGQTNEDDTVDEMRKFDPWPVFFRREFSRNWPFLVGFAVTGTIITKFSLGLTEEDAKNSTFVQRHKKLCSYAAIEKTRERCQFEIYKKMSSGESHMKCNIHASCSGKETLKVTIEMHDKRRWEKLLIEDASCRINHDMDKS